MTKLCLSYTGYADHCTGQLGDPAFARPISLMEGVLGFFTRDELKLHSFHIEHFQAFNDWESLKELLGEEVADKIYGLHQEIVSLDFPSLSELSEDELSATMKQSIIRKEFEVCWYDNSKFVHKLREVVDRWEA